MRLRTAIKDSLALSRFLLKNIQVLQDTHKLKAEKKALTEAKWQEVKNLLTPLLGVKPEQFKCMEWNELMDWAKSNAPYAQLFNAMLADNVMKFGAFTNEQLSNSQNTDKPFCTESGSIVRQQSHHLVKKAIKLGGTGVATRTLARLIEMAEVVEVTERLAPCPICNGFSLQAKGGDEMRIKELEVL